MKKIVQITLNLVFTSLIILSNQSNAATVVDCNEQLEKGDYTAAAASAESILKSSPNNRDGLLCKGRALGSLGQYPEALTALEAAAKHSQPGLDEIIAYIFIGNLHKKHHKNVEAIAGYEQSLKIAKASQNEKFERMDYNLIADTQAQNNDLNAALASYLAGSKLAMNDNERAESFERLATTYSALGQHDLAIEHQLKATLMQQKAGTLDEFANASFMLGQAYQNAKEYDHAEEAYHKLLKFSKDNGGAYYELKANYGLAQVKALKGDKTAAKTMLTEALQAAKTLGENQLVIEIDDALKKVSN